MIVTTYMDYPTGMWIFRIRDRENDAIEYDSKPLYIREDAADAAGHDAIDFSHHRKEMEGKL